MSDSHLSQEEIEALISQVRVGDGDDYADLLQAEEETAAPVYDEPKCAREKEVSPPQKRMAATRKVVFNSIDTDHVARKEARMAELNHVNLDLQIVLGETILTVGELLNLKKDSVIVLDRLAGENAQLLVNGKALADGEIVVLNDCFAFRVNLMEEGERTSEKKVLSEEGSEQ